VLSASAVALEVALTVTTGFVAVVRGLDLTESPVADPATGNVLFSDVRGGGVWEYGLDGSMQAVVPHRRGVGGMAFDEDGTLLITGRNVAAKRRDGWSRYVVETDGSDRPLFGFNGMSADDEGRLYVGGLASDPFLPAAASASPGGVYRIDHDGSHVLAYEDVMLPNGMAFDSERQLLYVCDSDRFCVVALRQSSAGDLSLASAVHLDGMKPDGLALGSDGTLWIAHVEDGCIRAVTPDGTEIARLSTPVRAVTSLCFGTDDPGVLFMTGGTLDRHDVGGLWAARVPTTGAERQRCRLALQ
jgi:gluconolactonase